MGRITNYSPLRYPGGKSKLYNLVSEIIALYNNSIDTYVEPFAGGAGIAIGLLLNNKINNIVINDINVGIYSFWHAICHNIEDFLRLLYNTEVNINNYNIQKHIYESGTEASLELGFATFFLNRTNFSGVLEAGPIGGYKQTGRYLIDARYNVNDLAKKIEKIAQNSSKIEIYNLDVIDFIEQILVTKKRTFTYFDPPYFVRGKELYTNFLSVEDHENICKQIRLLESPWLLTYDNVIDISKIYNDYTQYEFNLSYTVNSKVCRKGTELLITSDVEKLQYINQEICKRINLKLKEI